jgi:orotidine-5'-phosphate decarboxylase
MEPFLNCADKGIFVLCRTSNPFSEEFQSRALDRDPPLQLYEQIAYNVAHYWNYNGNCGLVVGATSPKDMAHVREIAEDLWFLVPGSGTQGGSATEAVRRGLTRHNSGLIINSGSKIIFSDNPKTETLSLHNEINSAISEETLEHT